MRTAFEFLGKPSFKSQNETFEWNVLKNEKNVAQGLIYIP